jgi:ATP-dependent DNA helicase RecQ
LKQKTPLVRLLLKAVVETKEIYKSKELVKTLLGDKNAVDSISQNQHLLAVFGSGAEKESSFWMALIRQALVTGFLTKRLKPMVY